MNRITAGGNLTIEIQPSRWRLVNSSNGQETPLVEANYGEPLRYVPAFATSRRLPDTGVLPNIYIQRVVLGWSNDDESWHLGFLLDSELAQPRGSRWCELVHWPDPDAELFARPAREAGESLATMMARPFHFVPARPAAPEPAAPALPPLPEKIEPWTIGMTPAGQIELRMEEESGRSRITRALWYFFLAILYIVLSILALVSGIALPRPEFLPFLGLAAAVILLGIAIRSLLVRGASINRILVHPEAQAIRGLHRRSDRWRYESEQLQAVYVTTVVARRARGGKQAVEYAEINVQKADDRFHFVMSQGSFELTLDDEERPLVEGVRLLTTDAAQTSLQQLALHIGSMLGKPTYSDVRYK